MTSSPQIIRTEPTPLEWLRGVAARRLRRVPRRALVLLAGGEHVVDGQRLDPMLRLATRLRGREPETPLLLTDAPRARALFRREILSVRGKPTPVASVETVSVSGGAGSRLEARVYGPTRRAHRTNPPLTVFFHGGGFASGDLDTHDEACRLLCARAGHVVLSAQYRLAPEHPFPSAYEDARAAFRWAQQHASRLGADPARVAVGGDSAGGNLAAHVAQACAEDKPPCAQLLIYPTTDPSQKYVSRDRFDGYFLSERQRQAFHAVHTRGSGVPDADPRLSPLRGDLRPDRGGLCPALVVTAGFDVLRDEGRAYAAALAKAGGWAEHVEEDALPHGFINMTALSHEACEATERLAERWSALVRAV